MGVMNVKTGTKNYIDRVDNPIQRDSGVRNVSATDQAKTYGDKDLGQVLNQLADANWVDPSKKIRTTGNDQLDKDAFMKLMLAQMKNQDPSNPLDSHQMAAQLAQFSAVEQLTNINETLKRMQSAQKPTTQFQALNLLGKAVAGDSSLLTRSVGDVDHDFSFNVAGDAAEVNIKVRNSNGDIVRTYDIQNIKGGENKITWNGQDERGMPMPPGDYHFVVEAKSAAGNKLAVKTDFEGVISGVNYTSEGPVLLIGSQTVRLSDVKKIVDPSLKQNDQKIKDVTSQDLKSNDAIGNNESNKAAVATPVGDITSSIAMSRDMMERVAKEKQTK